MADRPLKNIPASVHQRLLNLARETNRPFNEVLQYFAIERSGPCWDTIVSTQEDGVYIPDAIPNAHVELNLMVDA